LKINWADTTASGVPTDPEDTEFDFEENINFVASAVDYQSNDISSSIEWESDVDGAIGSGASINVDDLSLGVHQITATATDSLGRKGSDSISIEIVASLGITVTNISPDNGSTAGGTSVTITGTGFTSDCIVTFVSGRDEELAISVTIVSDTEIICNTPAWSYGAGFVDIFVTDTVTTEFGILANGFEYT
jgi:hypothetical protein